MIKKPIVQRLCEAFGPDDFELSYGDLAVRVFPPDDYPRSWRNATQGGPPGCYIALSAAIRRYGIQERWDRHDRRMVLRPPASLREQYGSV